MTIYPSILTDSLQLAQEQLDLVSGKVETVQLDIIDAEFADDITFTPVDARELQFHNLTVDVHLQTNDPVNDVAECKELGKHVRSVIAQVERMPSQQAFIDHVQSFSWKAGLSLDLFTPVSAIEEQSWQHMQIVQVMSIYAGSQGQVFQDSCLKKIKEIKEYIDQRNLSIEIVVDGGITPDTAQRCLVAGANSFSVGSFLWQAPDVNQAIFSLQQLV